MESAELLSFIDSMDLDEEYINKLLGKIITRSTFTISNMESALRFLKYKLAINKQESLSCSNEREYEFVGKLIRDMNIETVELVCQISNIVLQLDPKSIVSKSEHLLQQILSEIELPTFQIVGEVNDDETPKSLLDLKICSSIIEAVIAQKKIMSLPFLQVPLENMVFSPNEKVLNFFYTSTIPNFHAGVTGFSIIDRLWACLKLATEFKQVTLKALSYLADYFLPVTEEAENMRTESTRFSVAADLEFWQTVHFGLHSSDNAIRKRAIYLIKRTLESLAVVPKDININTEDIVIVWDKRTEKTLREMWDNFFILIDSLEEMQSNIVLPSLKLFESVQHLGHCWTSSAYNIGLRHDNTSVKVNCLMYRLQVKIENQAEATALLNAINDINLYENPIVSRDLTSNISKALEDKQSFLNILVSIPSVKWSPVPLYYLSETLGEVVYPGLLLNFEHKKVCSIINDILRIPCNSPVLKKAIYGHISNFIVNSCKGFTWEDYVSIYPNMHTETPITSFIMTALASHIKKNLYLSDTDKNGFAEAMTTSWENINIALLYVSAHEQDGIPYFSSIINDKVDKIKDICNRPYANKTLCIADVNFLINLYSTTVGRTDSYMVFINGAVMEHYNVILHYLTCILTSTISLDMDSLICLYDTLYTFRINDTSTTDIQHQLYRSCVTILGNKASPLDKKTSSVTIIHYLLANKLMDTFPQTDILSLEEFLVVGKETGNDLSKQSTGKLKSTFYEKSCEILLSYLKSEPNARDVLDILAFIEDVIGFGGSGCLKFILRIIVKILPNVIDNESVNFEFALFLNQMWAHICELKTNKEYVQSMEEFVILVTQDQLLSHPQYNTVILSHYTNIVDLATTKRMPIYFLVKHLSTKNVMMYNNIVHVLCNILLYAIVPKKDQRITENLSLELFPKMQGIMRPEIQIFSHHIQFLSVTMLSKVTGIGNLNAISDQIMSDIDAILKAKPRYHTNNTTYRKLVRAMQCLLFIFLKTRQVNVKKTAVWCMNLLRIPHALTVKLSLYWYIALYVYSSDLTIDSDLLGYLSENGVPLISQFTIVYFVMRHKIPARMHFTSETEFVLDFLLSNTMGPVFNIRLTAQYYAMMLFENGPIKKKINMEKYSSMIAILDKTLGDLVTSKDNSFNNLRNDYFTQTFDIVGDLTLMFIFHSMQRRCEQCTENIDAPYVMKIFTDINEVLVTDEHDAFFVEWKGTHRWHAFSHYQGLPTTSYMVAQDEVNTLQKKYDPYKSIADLDEGLRNNVKSLSDLIVVASLINRAPNLGGLARTCEVFGVMSYVIDNLRYVQDKQFQSLSVSADRWVPMEEVHNGRALKEYLIKKKKEGYSIVAAEQTSTSRDLTEFKFPKKTLLMLGNEKEGIPPNLLPLMDFCVEIPQQGVIRSLNVHVTASIFIWEYARQFAVHATPPYMK